MPKSASPDAPLSLYDDLARLDEKVLAEVVREAEQMVDAQFSSVFAADQRALTLAGIAATLAAAAIGALVAKDLSVVRVPAWILSVVFVGEALGLAIAAIVATLAALPSRFHFPGNEPENWRHDHWSIVDGSKHTIQRARVEQAIVLQAKITANRVIAARQARLVRFSVHLALGAIGVGLLTVLLAYLFVS